MLELKDKLIVALDVDTLDKARYFVNVLYPEVKLFKVGSQLFTACGPEVVGMIAGKGARVFLDLKFFDIPNTVYYSTTSASAAGIQGIKLGKTTAESVIETAPFPVFMMTVHIRDNMEMLKQAVRGAEDKAKELGKERPRIVGVTILTSEKQNQNTPKIVLDRANFAKNAGLDGVVCSVHEARMIREELGKEFIIVTPGIRPKGYKTDDQARVATARDALDAGADFIVVGRPILEAEDPKLAVQNLFKD